MARTVVGLFDNFAEAQAAVRDLVDEGVDRSQISLTGNDARGEFANLSSTGKDHDHGSGTATGAGVGAALGGITGLLVGLGALTIPGIGPVIAAGPLAAALTGAGVGAGVGAVAGGLIGALTDLGVPEEEAHTYAEGVRRGGTLVTVTADERLSDRVASIMNRHGAVDIDRRATQWRERGWNRFDHTAQPMAHDAITADRETYRNDFTDTNLRDQGEARIPVVEEELQVGKRQVERGGVRVYSRVVEQPVQETVALREEHVDVERRAVNRPVNAADDALFQERSFEVRETGEEAIVAKEARVAEEVVIRKDVDTRQETVRDTVRRTDVDVEQLAGTGVRSSTTFGDYNSYANDFRSDFSSRYAGRDFTQYEPAYRYGHTLATDQRYQGQDWNAIEPHARRDWEARGQGGGWDQFKDNVRDAWEHVSGRRGGTRLDRAA